MPWEKQGLVYVPNGQMDWAVSHAYVPTAYRLSPECIRVYAAFLDAQGVGRLGYVDVAAADPQDFWEPVHIRKHRSIILDPGEFYILASREAVSIPPEWAAEMVPFDPLVGEFRVHYAGFFDPGFGYAGAGGQGSRAVLEVRSREVPFILEHGQIVGRLVYERMLSRPDALYGQRIASNYQGQGLKLSKHFRV